MKKLLVLVSLLALVFTLCGCSKFTCDACGETKTGKSHEIEFMGQSATMCDSCYKQIKGLGSQLGF